jgi:hypothetical protein
MSWSPRGGDIYGAATGDNSGMYVSLSSDGNILAIGAPYHDAGGANSVNRGHVRVYAWNALTSTWEQRGADIYGNSGDQAGMSVSLSSDGSIVAVGAPFRGGNVGSARIYQWNGNAWVQLGSDINGSSTIYFGWCVSLSSDGHTIGIGAYFSNPNNIGAGTGTVAIYNWNATASTWEQRGSNINGLVAGDQFGRRLSISSDGNVIAIGGAQNDGGTGTTTDNRGHVRVFVWNAATSTWDQRGSNIVGKKAGDQFGWSVSLSSDGLLFAAGSLEGGTTSANGQVSIYIWNASTSTWDQRGSDINGEAVADQFGYSVSLSSDGTILAVGATGNDLSGSNSGRTYIYTWNGTNWVYKGDPIGGKSPNDGSGRSVSLSSNGDILAIGAIGNDGTTLVNTDNRGHVRVYRYPVPYTPTDLSGTPGNQTAQISFTVGDNGGSVITNYMYSTDGGVTFTAFSPAQTTSPVTITGLTNGTPYNIQLKAVNANGSSTASATVAVTPAAPAPSGGGGGGSSGGGGGGGGIPCIPAGQRILTPQGYKPVETLKQGDLIQTSDGRAVPVHLYSTTIEKTTEETAPIRIGTSLLLSPMHAFKVNKRGWMIPKLAVLKNLYDAKQEPLGETITYYHVETANYLRDNLVVEGTVVEGYGKTFAKTHNLSVKDIYKRSKNGPWLERIGSVPPPSKAKN